LARLSRRATSKKSMRRRSRWQKAGSSIAIRASLRVGKAARPPRGEHLCGGHLERLKRPAYPLDRDMIWTRA
jgi:hypothetical protein